jgi:hypothetical protein
MQRGGSYYLVMILCNSVGEKLEEGPNFSRRGDRLTDMDKEY